MTDVEAREAVKSRLSITSIDFDDDIDSFVDQSVKRLYPAAMKDAVRQTHQPTITNGEAYFDLATLGTPLVGVRLVEASSTTSGEYPVEDIYQHGTFLRVRGIPSSVSTLYIYGLVRYTLANLDEELELALIYFAISEFYSSLVGSSRKYNVYTENGRGRVETLQDLSAEYEGKAIAYIDEHAPLQGRQ